MSRLSLINLSKLPRPDVIKPLSFHDLLGQMKTRLTEELPTVAPYIDLESEPMVKLLEVAAYYRMLDRAEFNDGVRANMLAFATGADLDNLAANWGVARLVIQEADDTVDPAIPQILEDDDDFRERVQLSLEAHTTAGSRGAYLFHALSAHGDVKDAHVSSPEPGKVEVLVLSREGDGVPSPALLDAVSGVLSADDVRPLTDLVEVKPATILGFDVVAQLTVLPGPGVSSVTEAVNAALEDYLAQQNHFGRGVTRSGLFAALHQAGVQNVLLSQPPADIESVATSAPRCQEITLTVIEVGND